MRILQDRKLVLTALLLQVIFLVVGFVAEFWLMTAFCTISTVPIVTEGLAIIWLALTLSPLIGALSLAEGFDRLRIIYFLFVIAMPAFLFGIQYLNNAGALTCEAL